MSSAVNHCFLMFDLAGKVAAHARRRYARVKEAALQRLSISAARRAWRRRRAEILALATT